MDRYQALPPAEIEEVEGINVKDSDYKDARHAVYWRIEDTRGERDTQYFATEEHARAKTAALNRGG